MKNKVKPKRKEEARKQIPDARQKAQNNPSEDEVDAVTAFFNQRRYAEGEVLAEKLTKRFPHNGFVWKVLGAMLQMQGKNAEALLAMQRAVTLSPGDEYAHYNLGNSFKALDQFSDAEENYRRTLQIKPDFWEAYYNLGITLKALGRLPEAEESYRRALQIKPDFTEGHYNLGNLLKSLDRFPEAEESYRRALQIKPDYMDAHYNLGNLLKSLDRFPEAEESYRRALQIKPDFAEAQLNLADIQKDLGRIEEAEAGYRRVLQIKPDFLDAHYGLLKIMIDQGRFTQAEDCCRRILNIKPDCVGTCYNLGNIHSALGRFTEAEACYRQALEIQPDCVEAYDNLLFCLNYIPGREISSYLEEARRYGRIVAQKAKACFSSWSCDPHPRTLRVGLVSGDLRNHPVGYFLESILPQIDPSRLQLMAYLTSDQADDLTGRIKPYFKAWKSLTRLSNEAAANLIHDDGIHILLDLAGHTGHNGLPIFAWKPAPIQVSWLGYIASTGLDEMDYLLGDPYNTPLEEAGHFTETIWQLPETRFCFTPPDIALDVVPPPALTSGFVTFGCFNNLTKINDGVVGLWSKILLGVPGSRLFLKAKQLNDPDVCNHILRRFAACSISSERLILEGVSPRAEYLKAYNRLDINLDPFPFPGGTTSVEGLWMGVPLITLRGNRFISHQGEGLLRNAGLSQWIAENENDYLSKAIMYATNPESLASLRAQLREQILTSPLFDAPRFGRHLEGALWAMWEQWQKSL